MRFLHLNDVRVVVPDRRSLRIVRQKFVPRELVAGGGLSAPVIGKGGTESEPVGEYLRPAQRRIRAAADAGFSRRAYAQPDPVQLKDRVSISGT